MKTNKIIFASFMAFVSTSIAADVNQIIGQLKSTPYQISSPSSTGEKNVEVFSNYCVGNPDSADIPAPNYANPLVAAASKRISETKIQADAKLKVNAQKQFAENVKNSKEQLQQIKSSKVAGVNEKLAILSNELDESVKTGKVSENAKKIFNEIQKLYVAELGKSIPQVAQKLTEELKGVDVKKLKSIGLSLSASLEAKVKSADIAKIKTWITELAPLLRKELVPVDMKQVKESCELIANSIDQDGNINAENLKEIKKLVQKTLDQIKNNGLVANQDINYWISDIVYYLESEQKEHSKNISNALATLKAETSHSTSTEIETSLKELETALSDSKSTAAVLNSTSNNFFYNIQEFKSKNDKLNKLLESFKNEIPKFQADKIFSSIKAFKAAAEKPTDSTDYTTNLINAGDTLSYRAETVAKSLDENGSKQLAELKAELALQESENIKTNAKNAKTELDKANGEMTKTLMSAVNDLFYNLETKLNLSSEAQKSIELFKVTGGEIQKFSPVNETLTQALEVKLSQHYYFYSSIKKIYKLNDSVPANAPAGTVAEAHQFITQLCGEFRDRASMIEAKIKWVNNLFILPKTKQNQTIDPTKNIWSQVSAESYSPYLQLSRTLWEARRSGQERYIQVGDNQVDNPVRGTTVCETKYIFANYISQNKQFDDLASFNKGYEGYKVNCPSADLVDYYDFRGDSNFKHYSPESNGMIWYATSLAAACKSATEVKPNVKNYTSSDCENYFKRPFYYRYNAARAGLATWLFRDDKYTDTFSAQGKMVAIYPHNRPELAPLGFSFDFNSTDEIYELGAPWLSLPGAWNTPDIGFNMLTGLGDKKVDLNSAYTRIRDAVDRHTDWYNSGFNDKNGVAKNQAYSPFVASSYEMSASDGFTSCGTTVQCPPDGLKRWMFVFRIKPQNWYTPARILNNEPVNFDTMWFDETSFGRSSLADGEKAWDRLGTAIEGEFDSILYLINVNDGGSDMEEGGH